MAFVGMHRQIRIKERGVLQTEALVGLVSFRIYMAQW